MSAFATSTICGTGTGSTGRWPPWPVLSRWAMGPSRKRDGPPWPVLSRWAMGSSKKLDGPTGDGPGTKPDRPTGEGDLDLEQCRGRYGGVLERLGTEKDPWVSIWTWGWRSVSGGWRACPVEQGKVPGVRRRVSRCSPASRARGVPQGGTENGPCNHTKAWRKAIPLDSNGMETLWRWESELHQLSAGEQEYLPPGLLLLTVLHFGCGDLKRAAVDNDTLVQRRHFRELLSPHSIGGSPYELLDLEWPPAHFEPVLCQALDASCSTGGLGCHSMTELMSARIEKPTDGWGGVTPNRLWTCCRKASYSACKSWTSCVLCDNGEGPAIMGGSPWEEDLGLKMEDGSPM